MKDILSCKAVVTTFHFLRASKPYAEMVESALSGRQRSRPVLSSWSRVEGSTHPLLEAVGWRRVVVDEIHDTFDSPRDLAQLRLFRPGCIWGITATPPLYDLLASQHLYLFLSREKAHHPNLLAAVTSACIHKEDFSPGMGESSLSLNLVRLSAEERLSLPSASGQKGVESVVRHCTVGETLPSLPQSKKRDAFAARVEGYERSVRVMETTLTEMEQELERRLHSGKIEEQGRDYVDSLREACESQAKDLGVAMSCLEAEKRKMLREDEESSKRRARETLLLTGKCQSCAGTSTTNGITACCSTLLCSPCLSSSSCPLCGSHPLLFACVPSLQGRWTKMRRIVDLVLSLSEPVLMFVQWKSMLRQTKTFLTSAGIHVLLLDGNSSQRASMLEDFLSSGVLLLCLEDSFAGLHLPHVRNVIFAHAIVGDRAHVDRLEGQAIARCRRYGQTETVHIHSFVVTDSEEESLWKRTHDSSPPVSTSPSCETN